MDYTGEYTGPYWSNGEIQESVEWGEKDPKSQLDWLSRQHDSAYAHFKDRNHREAADLLYMREAKKLAGKYPELAGNLVGYGNYAGRQIGQLASDVGLSTKLTGNPILGALKFTYGNLSDTVKRINGTYLKNELKDVQGFYGTDPYKKAKPNPSNPRKVEVKGSFEKVKVKPSTIKVVSQGEEHEGRIRGWVSKTNPKSQEAIATSLQKPGGNEMYGDVAVHHNTWFQRLKKKKKKKNAVESLETRIQRLTLNQKRRLNKFDEKRETALTSEPKKKNKAFGMNRAHAVREQAIRNKNC